MTPDDLEELIADCPRLYHMASRGAYAGIARHGLLSTLAVLDLYGIGEPERTHIALRHRQETIELNDPILGRVTIRDQKPMDDKGLIRALPPTISPSDWYARLNSLVFFWMSEKRVDKLSKAKAYRNDEHELLIFDTRSIIDAYRKNIWLCPANSGSTKPMPWKRDFDIFRRIEDYDYSYWRQGRSRGERVVELCIDYAATKITDHLVDAWILRNGERVAALPRADK